MLYAGNFHFLNFESKKAGGMLYAGGCYRPENTVICYASIQFCGCSVLLALRSDRLLERRFETRRMHRYFFPGHNTPAKVRAPCGKHFYIALLWVGAGPSEGVSEIAMSLSSATVAVG